MKEKPQLRPRSGRPLTFLAKWDVPILILFIGVPMLAIVGWISIAAIGDRRDEARIRELTGLAPGMVGAPLDEVIARHGLPSHSSRADEWSHRFLIVDRRRNSEMIESTWLCLNVDENGVIVDSAIEAH